MKLLLAIISLAALWLAGCQVPGPGGNGLPALALPPNSSSARNPGLSTEEQARARQLYAAKCARCHKFYDPANYSYSEWQRWMTKMSRKARLKPEQEQLLSRYLDTFRGEPSTRREAQVESKR